MNNALSLTSLNPVSDKNSVNRAYSDNSIHYQEVKTSESFKEALDNQFDSGSLVALSVDIGETLPQEETLMDESLYTNFLFDVYDFEEVEVLVSNSSFLEPVNLDMLLNTPQQAITFYHVTSSLPSHIKLPIDLSKNISQMNNQYTHFSYSNDIDWNKIKLDDYDFLMESFQKPLQFSDSFDANKQNNSMILFANDLNSQSGLNLKSHSFLDNANFFNNTLFSSDNINIDNSFMNNEFMDSFFNESLIKHHQDSDGLNSFIKSNDFPLLETKSISLFNSKHTESFYSMNIGKNILESDFNDSLNEKIIWLSNQKIQSAKIHIDPVELGPIDISINISEDGSSVGFVSQHSVVREILESNSIKLRELFEQQGLDLIDVDISDRDSPTDHSDHKSNQRQLIESTDSDDDIELNENSIIHQASMKLNNHIVDDYI